MGQQLRTYFRGQYAGQKDTKEIQTLQGSCREFDAECVWGYVGWQLPNISHLRLGFYTADIFAPEPTHQRDVAPIQKLLREVQPDVISVALDPEASGPDTHYKVLQAITAALQKHADETNRTDLVAWGYRNVWFRFHPCEVSTIIPVSLQTISTLNHMFLQCFESQRDAEFPAYEIQGPFCAMSQKVQVEQYDMIEQCLGYEWFHNHPSPLAVTDDCGTIHSPGTARSCHIARPELSDSSHKMDLEFRKLGTLRRAGIQSIVRTCGSTWRWSAATQV